MKTTNTLRLLLVALLLVAGNAQAQTKIKTTKVDSTRLSSLVEGDYQVDRYLVEHPADADYAIRYRIGNATLNAALGQNSAALGNLKGLVDQTLADTLNRVVRVKIDGYASPDGPAALNRSLSMKRAKDMQGYLDRNYHLSSHYPVTLDGITASWSDAIEAVSHSTIPHRDAVLAILSDRSLPESGKQARLKQLPGVWPYLAAHILPPMRRVEVEVAYLNGSIVEHRSPIEQPAPTDASDDEVTEQAELIIVEEVVQPVVDPCCEELLRLETIGIIIEMPDQGVDFE